MTKTLSRDHSHLMVKLWQTLLKILLLVWLLTQEHPISLTVVAEQPQLVLIYRMLLNLSLTPMTRLKLGSTQTYLSTQHLEERLATDSHSQVQG